VEVPRITGSGYVKAMEKVDPQKTTQKGVTLEAQVIPDGYSYLLAKQIEAFENTGYEGEELKKRVKSYHSQISDYRGKVLFLVSVTVGADTACFFTKDVPDLVVLSQKKATKTLSIRDVDPKLEIKKWKMFEHPAFGGTKRSTPGLARVRDLTFKAVSSTLKITDKEPVTFAIKKLLAQTKGNDPQNSVNFEERQLSVRSIDDIVIPSLEVTFRPTRWDIPKPPDGFAELVEWLRSK